MLSVVIITHNEEDWVENCLASVKDVAGEIVVVDDGSSDQTVAICKKLGARVFEHKWEGFSKQKNFAAGKTSGDWLFFIDADERISAKLGQEILSVLKKPTVGAFAIPRKNIFLGQEMRHGGWWPDYVTRLIKKDQFLGWTGELHEELKVTGQVVNLGNPLFHLSHRGITWMLNKSINYIQTEAKLRYEMGHPQVTWWRFFRVMGSEFWYRMVTKSGWQDGIVGVIEAISQAYNMFLIYVHLWEMQKGKSMADIYKKIDSELSKNGF